MFIQLMKSQRSQERIERNNGTSILSSRLWENFPVVFGKTAFRIQQQKVSFMKFKLTIWT